MYPGNTTCCLDRKGSREITYHNSARIPTIAEAWTMYYEDAGYSLPTTTADTLTRTSHFSRNTFTSYTSTTPSIRSQSLNAVPTSTFHDLNATNTSEPIHTSTILPAISPREKAIIGTSSAVGALGIVGVAGSLYVFRRLHKRSKLTGHGILAEMDASRDRHFHEAQSIGMHELIGQNAKKQRPELMEQNEREERAELPG